MEKTMKICKYSVIGVLTTAMFAFSNGCKTIKVESLPGARVECEDYSGNAPAELQVWMWSNKQATISKGGYASRTVPVSFGSPTTLKVSLDRKFNIDSNENGATVYVDGVQCGTTPAKDIAIGDNVDSVVYVKKKGFVESEKITITPDTPTDIRLNMDVDGAGRYLFDIVQDGGGVRVKSSSIHATTTVAEPSRTAPVVHKLTNQGNGEYILSFSILPNGKKLATSILKEEETKTGKKYNANLWNLDAANENVPAEKLTFGDSYDLTPNASIDGKTLYYSSTSGNGRLGIWVMDMDNTMNGYESIVSAEYGMSDYMPYIDPTGKILAYTEVTALGATSLWTKELEGRQRRVQIPGDGYGAVWSPDGSKMLFVRGSKARNEARLWVRDTKSGRVRKLETHNNEYNDTDPRWSPDGKKIVFASNRGVQDGKHNYDIWLIDAEGGNPVQLTTNSSCDDKPAFSPDGKSIYFRSNRGLAWNIWVMNLRD